jgi:hypothetical protein
MKRSLAPEALVNDETRLKRIDGAGQRDSWVRKTYIEQWKDMGKEGLTQQEYDEGMNIAARLDELREQHLDALGKKVMEELKK